MIECIDIIKIYEDIERRIQIPALRGCDLFVDSSEMISIIGPSGSGKTTLINILAGLESISSGKVIVAGYNLSRLSGNALNDYRKRIISIVDQFPERTLFLEATVSDNIDFAYTLRFGDTKTTGEFKNKIMKKLGIEYLRNRSVKTLSGGEMARVSIACALAKRTPVLLCDEPTGQLDTDNTNKVKKILKEIALEFDCIIIVVTHDLRFLSGVDKTYEILDGRISVVLSQEERKKQSSFPILLKSYVDSTKSTRLPDLVYDTLNLEKGLEYRITKSGSVSLVHPEKLSPKKVTLTEIEKRRRTLELKPLPKNYFTKKDIIINLSSVSKHYSNNQIEIKALDAVNVKIYTGELLFVVGPSGSGKSTLLKVISGLEPCTTGEIAILGFRFSDLTDLEKARMRMRYFGILSQQGNMHPYLTIEDNLYIKDIYLKSETKINQLQKDKQKQDLLKQFNIFHRRKSYPLEISGGELQRALLAMT
ncbi:MAG: ATP-binding cassette domain-containing protein, partial [Asgard group archaeon]|nr:ATP-binding cassette domain-containing protein [Asgard group archaeon]